MENIFDLIDELRLGEVLGSLGPTRGAGHRQYDRGCLPGTRENDLEVIESWTKNFETCPSSSYTGSPGQGSLLLPGRSWNGVKRAANWHPLSFAHSTPMTAATFPVSSPPSLSNSHKRTQNFY